MTKIMREIIREGRNGKGKYCAVHTADRIGYLSNCPSDNWRWQRLNEVKDVMQKASEVQNENH